MSTSRLLAVTVGLAVAVANIVSTGGALADEPPGTTAVQMTFEQPEARGDASGISLSVRLSTADGEPITRQLVEFFVTPDFIDERLVSIRGALTDADGVATVPYTPTWEGEHRITARYEGDETYKPAEAISAIQLTGVPSVEIPVEEHLSSLGQWTTVGAVTIVIAVWLTLTVVLVRVGWGVWRAGRRGEAESSSVQRPERLPRATVGR